MPPLPVDDAGLRMQFGERLDDEREAVVRLRSPISIIPASRPGFSATFTTIAFDNSSLRWLEIYT